ncbi:hypothetical protein U8V72_14640 [Priestia filamentosa]|uniref:hypothetical protein n=1 Tax=Priestia filamentosa TaxID=1402861 RepID=UPI003978CA00
MHTIKDSHLAGVIAVDIEVIPEKKEEILREFPAPVFPQQEVAFNINEKKPGDYAEKITVLLNSFSIEATSNGGKWLKIELSNNNGKFGAKMWDRNGSVQRTAELLETYSIFQVSGKIEQFPKETGPKSIIIEGIKEYTGNANAFELLPATEKSIEDLTIELVTYVEEIQEPYKTVALKGLKTYWTEFSTKAAARGHHHAYLSGLLKHTLGLIRIIRFIRDQKANPIDAMNTLIDVAYKQSRDESLYNVNAEVPVRERDMVWNGTVEHLRTVFNEVVRRKNEEINFDLLVLAALFHDMGKMLEYFNAGESTVEKYKWLYPNADFSTYNPKPSGIIMDPIGGGTGHIIFSTMLLQQILVKENIVLKIEDIGKLNHCIAAHHGKLEWGSAAWMEKPEAFIIHFVDLLDARWEKADPIN